jgi:hypothetical protein
MPVIVMLSRLILQLSNHGADLFPIDEGRKVPLIKGWQALATSKRPALEAWRQQWPHCGFGWALPQAIVVTDLDMHVGDNGIADFQRIDGRDPRSVETPTATTASGGLHLYWASGGRSFLNKRIPGTAIDIKYKGGFVGVPDEIDGIGNGRWWLPGKAPWELPLALAPSWLDASLRKPPPATTGIAAPLSGDASVRRQGRAALARACERIIAAPYGEQHITLNRMTYMVGGLISRGDLTEDEAFTALLAAARAMPAHRGPWRDFAEEIADTLAAGMARPLPLSVADRFMRDLKARMRRRRPSHG